MSERNKFQGENASRVFGAEDVDVQAIQELYAESASFFADIIRQKMKPGQEYNLADLGCFGGELLDEFVKGLPEYKFHTFGIDQFDNLSTNESADHKIAADIENLPFADKSMDVVLMRYVLPWNKQIKQDSILQEVSRVVRGFAIVQHAGSDNQNPQEWRQKISEMFISEKVPKLNRDEQFFSSESEIEDMLNQHNIKFERIQSKKIDGLSHVFCEKYNLSDDECTQVRQILGDKDYIIKTAWIIYPSDYK